MAANRKSLANGECDTDCFAYREYNNVREDVLKLIEDMGMESFDCAALSQIGRRRSSNPSRPL
jgi:hypothetical protein